MTGFKKLKEDMTWNGFRYEVGKVYETAEEIDIYDHGFHFRENINDCFDYFYDPEAHLVKIETLGRVIESGVGSWCVTDKIRILEEIPREEAMKMANTGKRNFGIGNTGIENTGNANSGNRNSGIGNSGNENSGDDNSGDNNYGDRNSGSRNFGSWNSGKCNSGDSNSGCFNSGFYNSGDENPGDWNSGNGNPGKCNSGDNNPGDYNTGCWNTGDRNSGRHNSGCCNSGHFNSGNHNSGDWNVSSGNSGCFMTVKPTIMLFNKPSDWTIDDWRRSRAGTIMSCCPSTGVKVGWIKPDQMTEEEKKRHPYPVHTVTGGFLRTVDSEPDRQTWWDGLDDDDKKAVMNLPNFDADVFFECTGIRV